MGTRADFYIGRGPEAEWIGSIAYDGYPEGIPDDVLKATTVERFRANLMEFFASISHASLPEQHGWPWPWENSNTTDYAYAFDDGQVWGICFGHAPWWPASHRPEEELERHSKLPDTAWPDMSSKQNVTFGHRSGAIFLEGK